MPIFGRQKTLPIPSILPIKCPNCGTRLHWVAVTEFDPVIGIEKADHYKAECQCGEVHYRDGRGQVVEPAIINLPPDKSDVANSPQGPQPYSGYAEFVKQEKEKAVALAAKKAAAAAAPPAPKPAAAATPAAPAAATEAPAAATEAPAAAVAAPAAEAAPSPPAESETPTAASEAAEPSPAGE